jgi:hypothetical protein
VADSLARYASARDDVAALLEELSASLEAVAHWHGAGDDLLELRRYAERLRTGRFVLAVVGEFSSGKSFLLNALLGKIAFEERAGTKRIAGLLATDINPSTDRNDHRAVLRRGRIRDGLLSERAHRTDPDGRPRAFRCGRRRREAARRNRR